MSPFSRFLHHILMVSLLFFLTIQSSSAQKEKAVLSLKGQFSNKHYILDYNEKTPSAPMIIVLHGAYGNAISMKRLLTPNMHPLIRKHGFLVAYLNGNPIKKFPKKGTWNAGRCCGRSSFQQLDDVSYLNNFIDHAIAEYKVDPDRIYMIGYSNGAMMAYRFICEHPHRVAAITAVSGTVMTNSCSPSGVQGVLHIHGVDDRVVPVKGGRSKYGMAKPNNYTPLSQVRQIMKEAGVTFVYRVLPGVRHGINTIDKTLNLPLTAWSFFERRTEAGKAQNAYTNMLENLQVADRY